MAMIGRCLRIGSAAILALALAGFWGTSFAQGKKPKKDRTEILPVIFVHGFAGSAAQYQSQAMRFSSNGVPDERILAFEYDTANLGGLGAVPAALDAFVDQVRARFNVERVNLVGHSLGTFISNTYLSSPERAAKVAKYIGIDGASNPTCGSTAPGTLSCLGIFRGSTGDVGGNNVYFNDTQTHVEVATSPESFAAQYEFLTGKAPETTRIVPAHGPIEVSGRVVEFPANFGADGAVLSVWHINAKTARRLSLVAVQHVGADGSWGPIRLHPHKHYEFAVQREGVPQYHFYFQPFPRDTHLVRMNISAPGSDALVNTNTSPAHSVAVISRQKEWWVNHPSGQNDLLTIATRSRSGGFHAPVDALAPLTNNASIAVHAHDDAATPLVSSLALLPFFPTQAFQTGVDVYMPAADPTDGTIHFVNAHRGNLDKLQVIRTRNWASSEHRISVNFNDYVQ